MTLSDASLPIPLYTAVQCRELDRIAIEEQGIPGIVLMKRAGRVAFETLMECWPSPGTVSVFCGSGNNAGDGYLIAGLAAQKNVPVRVVQVGDPAKLKGDAAKAYEFARQEQVPMFGFPADLSLEAGVVVDAMLGTGARGAPRGDYAQAIQVIGAAAAPVLAIDIPSGLDPDTGQAPGECVRATATVTFIGLKQGLFTGRAPALVGRLRFDRLGIPDTVYDGIASQVQRVNRTVLRQQLAPRAADAHKGHFGHVLVVGGERGTGGAALLAAEAAVRTGAGLVSVATRLEHCASFLARRPELMVRGVDSADDMKSLVSRASVLVIGPGLGQTAWSRELLQAALESDLPLVVDADGLNLISQQRAPAKTDREWVLTPHPGEAGRLLDCSAAEIQADRFAAVRTLQAQYGGSIVLKGAGSLIASRAVGGERIAVADTGNPGMASGGMGDILSGVLGGLLAQGIPLAEAAELGVLLHGEAANLAAESGGERGLLATDLLPPLRRLVNPL